MSSIRVHVSRPGGDNEITEQKTKEECKTMQRYLFYNFNGEVLINKILDIKPKDFITLDFSNRTRRGLENVILSTDSHFDNAMFYQVKKCIEQQTQDEFFQNKLKEWNEYSLRDLLIYIDFSHVFPIEKYASMYFHMGPKTDPEIKQNNVNLCKNVLEKFFADGFRISYEKNPEGIHYVPFEKSASMAREGIMLFIDSRLHADMEERLRIGLNFNNIELSPSKLYAYTGLYLSDAKRIPQNTDQGFVLNEKTVIVISDNASKRKIREKIITGTPVENQNKKAESSSTIKQDHSAEDTSEQATQEKKDHPNKDDGTPQEWSIQEIEEDNIKIKINDFDGEGLISLEYCKYINEILHSEYGLQGVASSLQIRGLPFSKGMLHSVDFHGFIKEQLKIKSLDNIYITDAFGIRRNLGDAHILLTQSMFKAFHRLKETTVTGLKPGEDIMKLYFDRCEKYDHALYIGITDMNMSTTGRTKINYQFLNTLALEEDELNTLIKNHVNWAQKSNSKKLIQTSNESFHSADETTDFDQEPEIDDTWLKVAAQNPFFINDPKVKGMVQGMRYSLLKDIGKGKFSVHGSNKFLSRDLLALLRFILDKVNTDGYQNLITKKEDAQDQLAKELLRKSSFFTTDCIPMQYNHNKSLHLKAKHYYGILRNPHLSRNEQCVLKPYIPKEDNLYIKYFGHLNGILMVAQSSLVPQILGGADFDGDIVKLVTDPRICRAIVRGCYQTDKPHIRKLPVVVIPESVPRKIILKDNTVDCRTIQDTFSNQIGAISNRAIYYGKREYDPTQKHKIDRNNHILLGDTNLLTKLNAQFDELEDYTMKCEACTILTGLEIDAAKTGKHPYLGDILREGAMDYFVQEKEMIEKLPKRHMMKVVEQPAADKMLEGLSAVWAYGEHKGDMIMHAVDTSKYQNSYYPIDQLPYEMLAILNGKTYQDVNESQENNQQTRVDAVDDIDDDVVEETTNDRTADTTDQGKTKFAFEQEENWRKKVSDKELLNDLADMIQAYNAILNISGNVYKIKERLKKSNYAGCINVILQLQYEGIKDRDEQNTTQETVYQNLVERLGSYAAAEKALKALVEGKKCNISEPKKKKYNT